MIEISKLMHREALTNVESYYPFGMEMPGRSVSSPDYSYGFNGMEKDTEWNGTSSTYHFGARIYDGRVGSMAHAGATTCMEISLSTQPTCYCSCHHSVVFARDVKSGDFLKDRTA
ncbi:MAG: hypothetical protein SH856_04485 [Flavobacteriales bacterium]|nr:hypothetical protein [Flavobacteriales bacterium]